MIDYFLEQRREANGVEVEVEVTLFPDCPFPGNDGGCLRTWTHPLKQVICAQHGDNEEAYREFDVMAYLDAGIDKNIIMEWRAEVHSYLGDGRG